MNIKEKETLQDWELYWAEKKHSSNIIFDIIARFYRKFIIKNILNHFIKKYFTRGQEVLHAGCGSGQVDTDIATYMHITALDISTTALSIYESIHKNKCKTVQGSIFNLPFENETFEGIYNLGVMEHFTEEEIHQILLEFKRVLKPDATMVILWPPTFGLTVMVLDFAHFVLNKILRRNIKLHPDEISRVKSQAHVKNIFEKAGFGLQEYYFGIRDFFTQAVIVVQKVN